MTARDAALLAAAEIGTVEDPPGSNCQPYSHALGRPCEQWCQDFCEVMVGRARGTLFVSSAFTNDHVAAFQAAGRWDQNPAVGDLAYFTVGTTFHVGVIESWTDTDITTVDGNTGRWEGDADQWVARRTRPRSWLAGIGHPRWEAVMQILDAASKIPAAAARQAGFGGVIRYVAPWFNGAPNPKCITAAELADDLANGMQVGVVFEQGATNCLGGAAQGHIDGAVSVVSCQSLGFAPGGVIYAAVDYNAPTSDWPTIAAYLDAFRSEVHAAGYRQGGYGRYALGLQMLHDNHAEAWWESGAWSGDHRLQGTPGADLFQRIGQVTVGGVICDVNDVWADDWGQWPRPTVTAQSAGTPVVLPQPTAPLEEDDMKPVADTPSWCHRQPDGAFPRFQATPDDQGNAVVVSIDNAPFTPPWSPGDHGAYEDFAYLGLWCRKFHGGGIPFGYGEADGSFFLIAEHGTYDLAHSG